MELGYKALQAKPALSVVDSLIDGLPIMWAGAFAVVFVLFGADAWAGAMMLLGY